MSEEGFATDEIDEDDDEIDDFLREVARIPHVESPFDRDRSGERLGGYAIERKLGAGGMGVVYAATDTKLGRRVALKLLPEAMVGDPARRKRLLREARAAAAIQHASIATVYEAGELDGDVFIAMELLDGVTLRARLESSPGGLKIAEAQRIALALARGVGFAHEAGVVHRDLKPENVMLLADGTVKLLDFGLAKVRALQAGEGSSTVSEEGRVAGTPSYMSPEQAKGRAVGPASDVFSLGVMLYELLTGKRPFTGASSTEVLIAIDRDSPAPLGLLRPDIPRALGRVVSRCLEKAPEARYADASELHDALVAAGEARSLPARAWALIALGALAAGGVALLVGSAPSEEVRGAPSSDRPSEPVASSVTAAASTAAPSAPPALAASTSIAPTASASSRARLPAPSARPSASAPSRFDPLAHQK